MRLPTPRLLPLALLLMALVSAAKVALLVNAGSALQRAGQAMLPAARAAGPAAPAPSPAPAPAKPPAPQPEPPRAASAEPPPVEAAPSPAERAVLLDLRARRTVLEERSRTIDSREAMLAAAERRLDERVQQLAGLQAKLEALDASRRERDEANWRGLVKTYEAMRPRDAAAIFNDLDQPVLIQVLDRMKEAKAAPILAAMQPERARLATAELAKWRSRTTEPQG